MSGQMVWGTVLLGICMFLHVGFLVFDIRLLKSLNRKLWASGPLFSTAVLLGVAIIIIVISHSVQVWLWALSFIAFGAFTDPGTSVYFALVTYTTLGYGDIVLAENIRLYAAFASVTGLLGFGLSTAFLVAVFSKLLPNHLAD
ncbi:MAG: ion channel [Pseudomonadota bacterium]